MEVKLSFQQFRELVQPSLVKLITDTETKTKHLNNQFAEMQRLHKELPWYKKWMHYPLSPRRGMKRAEERYSKIINSDISLYQNRVERAKKHIDATPYPLSVTLTIGEYNLLLNGTFYDWV